MDTNIEPSKTSSCQVQITPPPPLLVKSPVNRPSFRSPSRYTSLSYCQRRISRRTHTRTAYVSRSIPISWVGRAVTRVPSLPDTMPAALYVVYVVALEPVLGLVSNFASTCLPRIVSRRVFASLPTQQVQVCFHRPPHTSQCSIAARGALMPGLPGQRRRIRPRRETCFVRSAHTQITGEACIGSMTATPRMADDRWGQGGLVADHGQNTPLSTTSGPTTSSFRLLQRKRCSCTAPSHHCGYLCWGPPTIAATQPASQPAHQAARYHAHHTSTFRHQSKV